jgi:hypothetical protein
MKALFPAGKRAFFYSVGAGGHGKGLIHPALSPFSVGARPVASGPPHQSGMRSDRIVLDRRIPLKLFVLASMFIRRLTA